MKKILITRHLPEALLGDLHKQYEVIVPEVKFTNDEIRGYLQEVAGVLDIGFQVKPEIMAAAGKQLKVYGTCSVGYDHVDVLACTKQGIAVVNTPNSVTRPTAEIAVGLIFDVMRRISYHDRKLRQELAWHNSYFSMEHQSLYGKTVGLVGFGRIGQCTARMLKACGMNIIYYNSRRVSEQIEQELEATYMPFEELLAKADVVSLHCPYRKENHHLMNQTTFGFMKPTAYFINTARGKLVDEEALANILKEQKIAGAGLDVFEYEPKIHPDLLTLDNVVLLPHIGTLAYDVRVEMVNEVLQGILEVLDNRLPYNVVNFEVFDAQKNSFAIKKD